MQKTRSTRRGVLFNFLKKKFTIFLAPTGKWEALWTALSQREAVAVDAAVVDAAVVDAEEEEEENSHFLQ